MRSFVDACSAQDGIGRSGFNYAHSKSELFISLDTLNSSVSQPTVVSRSHRTLFVDKRSVALPPSHLQIHSAASALSHKSISPVLLHMLPSISIISDRSSPQAQSAHMQPPRMTPTDANSLKQRLATRGSHDVSGSIHSSHGVKRPHAELQDEVVYTSVSNRSRIQNAAEVTDVVSHPVAQIDHQRVGLGYIGVNSESPASTFANTASLGMPPPPTRIRVGPGATSNGRYSLYLRQQPRASRAGPDGKDRRTVDPPPILQLMINGFNPNSDEDMADLKDHSWVVNTSLIVNQPAAEEASVPLYGQEMSRPQELGRLLLGTAVASPFHCADDPDPPTAPPRARESRQRSASPTSRFITSSRVRDEQEQAKTENSNTACTFFIFADLSIRKAGEYQLEFQLMRIPSSAQKGDEVATLATVTSNTFRVVNAKDFDQVQPSTNLVKGLLDRGAPYPLKLKKGAREGQRRKHTRRNSESNEEEDNEDEEE